MTREEVEVIEVEARAPGLQELGHLGVVLRGAEPAPLVDDMHLGRLALGVALDHADRAAPRPGRELQARERRADAGEMLVRILLARAHARAAPELVVEAAALARALEAERLQAQAVLGGEAAQRRERRAARAEDAMQERQRLGVDAVILLQAQPGRIEGKAAQAPRILELPVERGMQRFHQARLEQERAELAAGAPPLDAAQLAR